MKKFKLLLFGFILLFVMAGCAMGSEKDYDQGGAPGNDSDEQEQIANEVESSINRKIIYTVNAHISTDDLDATYKSIKNSLSADEWSDMENVSGTYVLLTLRIKSARLDSFLASLEEYGEVGNFSKEAKDVSLVYESQENKIASLEAERTRLNELYEQASINDMITINKRLSEISLEIGYLNGELKKFDSLVDYSVVHLRIYEHKLESEPTFGSAIGKAFKGGWNAVVSLLKFLVIALSAILPFAVIIVPVGGATYFIVKSKKKKNEKKDNELE